MITKYQKCKCNYTSIFLDTLRESLYSRNLPEVISWYFVNILEVDRTPQKARIQITFQPPMIELSINSRNSTIVSHQSRQRTFPFQLFLFIFKQRVSFYNSLKVLMFLPKYRMQLLSLHYLPKVQPLMKYRVLKLNHELLSTLYEIKVELEQ